MYRLGWFSTGRDQAARALLSTVHQSIESGLTKAQIAFVFSNREPGESAESDRFFEQVEAYHLPLVTISSQKLMAGHHGPQWRSRYDSLVMTQIGGYRPDLCVLAGYMLIVGEEMCRAQTMINLHPAAPGGPAGTWQEVIWKLIESGARESGVMMHVVTPELDHGPPATYCTFPIRGTPFDAYWQSLKATPLEKMRAEEGDNAPLFRLIRDHGLRREFPLIVATLQAFSAGTVRIDGGRVVDRDGQPMDGYDLTAEINLIVEQESR